MARLLADENFPLPVVIELRRTGHDVVTVQETSRSDEPLTDEQVLDLATADDRAVLTLNRRHFFRLHATGRAHAGIIACTFDLDFAGQAARVHVEIGSLGDLKGRLVRVNRLQR